MPCSTQAGGCEDLRHKEEDAADLLDFTISLLERLHTEPERLGLAKKRREKRRENQ